jgi:hypothetical protein
LLQLDPALRPPSESSPATTIQPGDDTPGVDRRRLCPACRHGHLVRLRHFRRTSLLSRFTGTTRAPPS